MMRGDITNMQLSNQNIKDAIDCLKENPPSTSDIAFILPISERVLNRDRYCGKYRPKKSDYDYVEIDWEGILNISREYYQH